MQTLFTAATCEDSLIGTVYLIVDDQQARLIDTDSLLITIMDDEVRNLEAVNLGEGEVELSWLQPYAFTPDVSYDVYLDSVIVNNTTENNIVITTDTGLHDFGVKAEYYDGFSELVTIQLEVTAYNKEELPLVSGIRSIFPNPFNPETTINYDLAEDGYVSISVYNLKGQKVVELVNITQKAGQNSVVLNADRLASGVYFVRMNTGNTNQVQKVILMK
jgi:hypothetical protein